MNKSKIEWTDRTWNPVTGCTKVSQGCKNCYAETMHERFNGKGSFKKITLHHDRLPQPSKWKQPSKIFVNSMSDLFHQEVDFDFIRYVFLEMSANKHHIFQVLTKRPERMLQFFDQMDVRGNSFARDPLPNVWLGVSVEDQAAAEKRIPDLLLAPAAVRFLSCEPLLGPVDISNFLYGPGFMGKGLLLFNQIHWVITGGESGHGARPMDIDWARSLRDQCEEANIPFFFKQWGEHDEFGLRVGKKAAGDYLDGKRRHNFPFTKNMQNLPKQA